MVVFVVIAIVISVVVVFVVVNRVRTGSLATEDVAPYLPVMPYTILIA